VEQIEQHPQVERGFIKVIAAMLITVVFCVSVFFFKVQTTWPKFKRTFFENQISKSGREHNVRVDVSNQNSSQFY